MCELRVWVSTSVAIVSLVTELFVSSSADLRYYAGDQESLFKDAHLVYPKQRKSSAKPPGLRVSGKPLYRYQRVRWSLFVSAYQKMSTMRLCTHMLVSLSLSLTVGSTDLHMWSCR